MNDDNFVPPYDETKDIEVIYDFHGSQVWRINTDNSNIFLAFGAEFDKNVIANKLDDKGRIRLIFVIDKLPPLTAIMKYIENPYNEVTWGVYAIVLSKDLSRLSSISPIIKYGLTITELRNKYAIKLFDYTYRNNLKEVIEWQDQNMDKKPEGYVDLSNMV